MRRPLARRQALSRQRRVGGATRGRDDPRASDQDERNRMSELSDKIKDVVENAPVSIFMKGTPQFIMCGNSDRALRALQQAGAPVTAVDLPPAPAIPQELTRPYRRPTAPHVLR